MSRSIAKNIRLIAFLGVLGTTAFLGYEFIQSPSSAAALRTVKASSVAETVKATAETGAQWTAEQTEEARKAWQHLDVDRKVSDLQDKTKPMGRKITAVVSPGFQDVEAGERRMSLPALLLILVFGTVFVLMGRSSNNGGR